MKNRWNSMPITRKLMLVTIAVFLVFCVVIFVGQIAFFEKYYTYIKSSEVKKAVSEFCDVYEQYDDEDILRTRIAEISDSNECYMMVLGKSGAVKYMLSYDMTVETEMGETLRFSLDNAAHDKNFSELGLKAGETVSVSFFGANEDMMSRTFLPISIKCGKLEWSAAKRDEPDKQPPNRRRGEAPRPGIVMGGNVREISGKIISIVLPSEQTRNINSERAAAVRAAMEWISVGEELADGVSSLYYFTEHETGEKYSVVIKSLAQSDGDKVFAIAPLNMVTEAVDVTRNVYIFFFVIAMGTACLLGIVFAKVVTRPVIEITNVTKSMAALDFSNRCQYSSNDEIGQLSENINILSDTLDSAINELQKANEKLMEDIEHERALEKSRREFVAAASHELKTPLGIIRAYTEAIMDGISENKRQHYSQVIVDETEKMDRLILDMLDNTKYEVGAEQPVLVRYDICSLIRDVIRRFEEVMHQKGIMLCENLAESAYCEFDVDMIERVLTNFIANAVAHTPENGTITITVCQNDRTMVSVENTGSHIDDADLEHIWDRFYKADKSRRRSSGGTGLGLSIAKNILALHKADYYAENTDNGVKFGFNLK